VKKEVHQLTTADGHKLFYRFLAPSEPEAVLLLLHGLAEHSGYYEGAIGVLSAAGIAVFAPDHRGHGYSGGHQGDMEGLEKLLEDAALVQAVAREKVPRAPLFVFGHSFGGQLALLYALRHQPELKGLILSAPLVLIPPYMTPAAVRATRLLSRLLPRLPVQELSSTRVSRVPQVIEQIRRDPLFYKGRIRARSGAVMLRGMEEASARMQELSLPLLMLHGEKDEIAELDCSRAVFDRAVSDDKTIELFPEAMHHVLLEPEGESILAMMAAWILERAG
jgi:alpha-beta hydrolase superfamily lysophospholipase